VARGDRQRLARPLALGSPPSRYPSGATRRTRRRRRAATRRWPTSRTRRATRMASGPAARRWLAVRDLVAVSGEWDVARLERCPVVRHDRRETRHSPGAGSRGSPEARREVDARRAARRPAAPSPPDRCQRPLGGTGRSTAWGAHEEEFAGRRCGVMPAADRRVRRRQQETISACSGSVSWNSSTNMWVSRRWRSAPHLAPVGARGRALSGGGPRSPATAPRVFSSS